MTREQRPFPPSDLSLDALEGLLLDARLGGEGTPEARRLEALRAEGAVGPTLARLEAFLARLEDAHAEAPDPERARGLSLAIRERVGAEETRARREPAAGRRRLLWARILAVSVAAHVVLLAALVYKLRHDGDETGGSRITVTWLEPLPPVAESGEDIEPLGSPWGTPPGALEAPRVVEEDPLLAAGLGELPADLAPLADHRFDHPPGVLGPMRNRLDEPRKRARLQRVGLDDDLTLAAVRRGLGALGRRQAADGSFPAADDDARVGATALVLLPFLGDGHSSREGAHRAVVAPGIAWLRRHLFDGRGGIGAAAVAEDAPALGIALKALSEDYMLVYGRLLPGEARHRADEIAALAGEVAARQRPDGGFPGAEARLERAVWPMWGLDAAARTGAVVPPDAVALRFAAWFSGQGLDTAAGDAAGLLLARHLGRDYARRADLLAERVAERGWDAFPDPFVVATTGTGLLRRDPAAYEVWSRGLDAKLARRLGPDGVVQGDDPVGQTALVLLALQAAYRTY